MEQWRAYDDKKRVACDVVALNRTWFYENEFGPKANAPGYVNPYNQIMGNKSIKMFKTSQYLLLAAENRFTRMQTTRYPSGGLQWQSDYIRGAFQGYKPADNRQNQTARLWQTPQY